MTSKVDINAACSDQDSLADGGNNYNNGTSTDREIREESAEEEEEYSNSKINNCEQDHNNMQE